MKYGIFELMLGTATEKATGVIYWNYSWIPLHLTKYTSVPTSLGSPLKKGDLTRQVSLLLFIRKFTNLA